MQKASTLIDPQKNYSLKKAAEVWGIACSTVRVWALQGRFRTVKMGRRRLVPGDEILRIKNEGLRG